MCTNYYLLFADTPVQVINCVSIASAGIQRGSSEKYHLVVYGQFDKTEQMYDFAMASGVFEEVCILEKEASPVGWQRITVFIELYFRQHYLSVVPDFVVSTHYSAMLFSCPTAVTFSLYGIVKRNNPSIEVILYEDGIGTYTGRVFLNLAYPGDTPKWIKNPPLVRITKSLLRIFSKVYRPYPITKLYVKCPDLLMDSFGLDIVEFSLDKSVLVDERLGSRSLAAKLSSVKVLYVEPPEDVDYYFESVEIERMLVDRGCSFAVRRHPRTLSNNATPMMVTDCTGGLWESLCCNINDQKMILVGFSSTSMLSPSVEFGLFPRIVILDYLGQLHEDASETDLIVHLLKTLYKGKESLIFIPKSCDELLELLTAKSSVDCAEDVVFDDGRCEKQ